MPQLDLGLVIGPQGPQGPEGPAGPQGPQGPQGEQSKVVNDLTTGGVDAALSAQMGVELENKKADTDLSNLDTPQAALANLGAGVRPNLLDNAFFVGGGAGWDAFPVNQRGQTSYSNQQSVVFGIDRWHLDWESTITLEQDGLTISGSIFQYLPPNIQDLISNQVVTISVLSAEGQLSTATGLCEGDGLRATGIWLIPNYVSSGNTALRLSSMKAVAAKLELGEGQTLAYQDSTGVWKLLPQPGMADYGAQLSKCRQYSVNLDFGAYNPGQIYYGLFQAMADNVAAGNLFLPTQMRTGGLPTISANPSIALAGITNSGFNSSIPISTIVPESGAGTFLKISIHTQDTVLVDGNVYTLWTGTPSQFMVSRDL